MKFELLKKVKSVKITDKKTGKEKEINIINFYLHSESLEKDIEILPLRVTYKDGNSFTNKDILSVLATPINDTNE